MIHVWSRLDFTFSVFEWDNDKAISNTRKHAVDFEEATKIFGESVLASAETEGGEARWTAIGQAHGREIVVVFTERGETCRIISARRPTRRERREYYTLLRE
jgi:uncharacterized DUF497 family protein